LRIIDEAPDFYTGAHILAMVCGAEEYMLNKKFLKERKIRALLGNFKILGIEREEAIKAAEIIGELKASGEDITLEEAFTFAHLLLNGLILVTKNREIGRKLKKMGVESKII